VIKLPRFHTLSWLCLLAASACGSNGLNASNPLSPSLEEEVSLLPARIQISPSSAAVDDPVNLISDSFARQKLVVTRVVFLGGPGSADDVEVVQDEARLTLKRPVPTIIQLTLPPGVKQGPVQVFAEFRSLITDPPFPLPFPPPREISFTSRTDISLISSREIEVFKEGTVVKDGQFGDVNCGSIAVGSPIPCTFTINNNGDQELIVSNLRLPEEFILVPGSSAFPVGGETVIPPFVNPNPGSVDFSIQLQEDTPEGTYSGVLSFDTNDTSENPFNFNITATAVGTAQIDVSPNPGSFGSTSVGNSVDIPFTVENDGTTTLRLSDLQVPSGFSLVGSFPVAIAAGESATFTIRLNATTVGAFTGNVSFTYKLQSGDVEEFTFNLPVSGTVTP
jgi:hypothetical protein